MRRAAALALAALWLSACGSADARVERFTIKSRAVDRKEAVSVVVPDGGAQGRPLVVFLHGRGGNDRSYLNEKLLGALRALGGRAPVVAFPDGGFGSYWHDRDTGDWGRYVYDEVLPRVIERYGVDAKHVAIGGISMGGFGALDLARLHPKRFCAVGAHSGALWLDSGQTAPGAFDDAADFNRHDDVRAARRGRAFAPHVWVDAGDADPFRPGQRALVAALKARHRRVVGHVWPGGHDGAYWDRHWRDYFRWYASALRAC